MEWFRICYAQYTCPEKQDEGALLPLCHLQGQYNRQWQKQNADVHDNVGNTEDHVSGQLVYACLFTFWDAQVPAGSSGPAPEDVDEDINNRVADDNPDESIDNPAEPGLWG